MEAVFKLNGNIAETRKWAAGPWNAEQQHGSAPSSLARHTTAPAASTDLFTGAALLAEESFGTSTPAGH